MKSLAQQPQGGGAGGLRTQVCLQAFFELLVFAQHQWVM